ncbi:MAG: BatA domain-containing protein, partial [Alphaproteobacteria bacterium]
MRRPRLELRHPPHRRCPRKRDPGVASTHGPRLTRDRGTLMLGLPIVFASPLVLFALAALPAIYILLRLVPPRPRRVPFPPAKILLDIKMKEE